MFKFGEDARKHTLLFGLGKAPQQHASKLKMPISTTQNFTFMPTVWSFISILCSGKKEWIKMTL